ncbi:MAG: redox-sensing transcriptional repressor Rex [Deltaproteobacteria bacterium]|nr:redox-sensing transcriptional repressor Rex [Deltaproteobacteria bacterium]MBW2258982.1 redox-sensing transcriptional repressor Rex [Deltaproteobacteria bacterium]
MKFVKIPSIAIARLSVYARNLDLLDQKGVEVISSGRLADICGVNPAQIRKDLAYFGQFGVRGVGYYVQELLPEIRKILGLDKEWRLGLVGAGNLGSALLRHAEFIHGSYTFVAAFDRKPKRIGATIGGVDVSPLEAMSRLVKKNGVEIGVIAVKPTWAQDTADLLVKAGVKGIMNFAPVHLQCPSQIFVENIDFGLRLERLFYRLTPPQSKRHRVHMKSGWVIAPK